MMPNKRYPLNQSPLFLLRNRRRLAELLGTSLRELESLANAQPPEYKFFKKMILRDGKPPKPRFIEWPKKPLQRVQRRLCLLLNRIHPPEYLHSGFRERSYLTNAAAHSGGARVAKIDIRKFFPSSSNFYVTDCFLNDFQCSEDVAQLLTKLTSVFSHLPTGGSTSSILSFFAYRPMFDEIHRLAVAHDLTMTCCVDDMTFSGERASEGFLNQVRLVVEKYGLKTHKRHCFGKNDVKVITGVAVTPKGSRVPNKRRLKLHEAARSATLHTDPATELKNAEVFLGRAVEASQIEEQFRPLVKIASKAVTSARTRLHRLKS